MLFAQSRKRSCPVPMTDLRRHPTPNRSCSPASTGFTASPLRLRRSAPTRAISASSLTEAPPLLRDEDRTMTRKTPIDRLPRLRLLGALIGLSTTLGACTLTDSELVTASVPIDYRQRHPIAVHEGSHSIVVFVGHGRGGLSPPQRADVAGRAQSWIKEGTGAIVADVPVDTPNSRAAAASCSEIRSVLTARGVPAKAITLHQYHPNDPRTFATIRLSYPKVAAVAGPCGLWPEDLGPSIHDYSYNENKPYYN